MGLVEDINLRPMGVVSVTPGYRSANGSIGVFSQLPHLSRADEDSLNIGNAIPRSVDEGTGWFAVDGHGVVRWISRVSDLPNEER